MYYSRLLLPTLKETPAEAELVSHKLMLRAGMIRKLAAGVYSYLPLGYRVIRRIECIVRQEMNAAGAQEVLLPVLSPAELWQESGRWNLYGPELMRLTDRHEREFCLGPTHEEVITDLVRREVRSYRALPLNLYQIQTKFRDEIRPRFGVMRSREFIMKDGYSFDKDEAGVEITYKKMYEAYQRIFSRMGLKFRAVEADSGPIGGKFSHEFMVLAESGEDRIINCPKCGYAANIERAEGIAPVANPPHLDPYNCSCPINRRTTSPMNGGTTDGERGLEKVATPGIKTVLEVSRFLKVTPAQLVKTLVLKADNQVVLALVRGDHEFNPVKLKNLLNVAELEMAGPDIIEQATGAPVGFAGPVGLSGKYRIIADLAVKDMADFVTGANEADRHYVNVNWGRDITPDQFADIREVTQGDLCPHCQTPLEFHRGIEVGHIFKLGTKYSKALNASFLDENGGEKLMIMGCYGIGVSRIAAAAIEQNHDQYGIIWPKAIAPFQMLISPLDMGDPQVWELAQKTYAELQSRGLEVLMDDRDERPGIKFKDADLIGIPLRLTIGARDLKSGQVELKVRRTNETVKIKPDDIMAKTQELLEKLS